MKSCRGGLVDDSLNVKACDLTRILGCLSLRVGEVCGTCNYRIGYRASEICLCICLQLLKDHSRNLLGSVALAVDRNLCVRSHISLDGADGLVGVGNSLTLCNLTNKSFACLGECNNRRSCSSSLRVGDNDGLATLKYCYAGVGCTQINAYNFSHNNFSSNI